MKKFLSALAIIAAVLGLSACSDDGSPNDEVSPSDPVFFTVQHPDGYQLDCVEIGGKAGYHGWLGISCNWPHTHPGGG